LPTTILADLFAIPADERDDFRRWSASMTAFFGGASAYQNADGIAVNASAVALRDYFAGLIARRRAAPAGDFLSTVLRENERFRLTDAEVIAQATMMLVAGTVTTTDQIANNAYTLLTRPWLRDLLIRKPELWPPAVEELCRFDPGVTFLFRVARAATQLGSRPIAPGAVVFLANHAINRDPRVFADPETLDPTRSPNPHLAFGHGAHFCVGAPLARVIMGRLLRRLLERYPRATVAHAERDHYSLAFSGFKELRLAL
jgi:cytochrome P450